MYVVSKLVNALILQETVSPISLCIKFRRFGNYAPEQRSLGKSKEICADKFEMLMQINLNTKNLNWKIKGKISF